jgi:hypothetical protein
MIWRVVEKKEKEEVDESNVADLDMDEEQFDKEDAYKNEMMYDCNFNPDKKIWRKGNVNNSSRKSENMFKGYGILLNSIQSIPVYT